MIMLPRIRRMHVCGNVAVYGPDPADLAAAEGDGED
jgi:hypothetical protein